MSLSLQVTNSVVYLDISRLSVFRLCCRFCRTEWKGLCEVFGVWGLDIFLIL